MSWVRVLSFFAAVFMIPVAAMAARPARVDLDLVEVREGPNQKYPVLFTLSKGEGLAAANVPIEGYYKIRAMDGRIGWVPADSLLFVESNVKPSTPAAGATLGASGTPGVAPPVAPETPQPTRRKWVGIRLLGGYGFFIPSEINAIINAQAIQNGFNVGLELGLLFSERFSAWVRAERIFQLAYAVESGGRVYRWDLSSWPVMAGLEFKIWSNRMFLVNVGALGGVGFGTDFSSSAINLSAPNRSTYFGLAYGFLARAGFSWTPTHWLQLGIQGGYRFLQTPAMQPASIGNGGELFQTNGQYRSVSIDMSGPFGEAVIGFQL